MKRVKPTVNIYTVLSRAVEEGAHYGVNRAYKHTDTPSRDTIIYEVEMAVMNALSEVVDYGENHE